MIATINPTRQAYRNAISLVGRPTSRLKQAAGERIRELHKRGCKSKDATRRTRRITRVAEAELNKLVARDRLAKFKVKSDRESRSRSNGGFAKYRELGDTINFWRLRSGRRRRDRDRSARGLERSALRSRYQQSDMRRSHGPPATVIPDAIRTIRLPRRWLKFYPAG